MCQSLYLNSNFDEIMKHLYIQIIIKQKLELKREEKLFFLYFVLLYLNDKLSKIYKCLSLYCCLFMMISGEHDRNLPTVHNIQLCPLSTGT